MTVPDSLEHLPNHACYGRKIHEGYMRRNTRLFVLIRQGCRRKKTKGGGSREKDVRVRQ